MTILHRIAGIGALAVLGWASACANHDTACAANYKTCGSVCCTDACNDANDGCKVPPGSSTSGNASSSGSLFGPKDPECESEVDPSKTKFCDSVGKCIDPLHDSQNCGSCDNVCMPDTNGLQRTCISGKCR